jgi:hypothetical protein
VGILAAWGERTRQISSHDPASRSDRSKRLGWRSVPVN